ncbi:MAG: aminopeptidase P N-terminal domain-containing protein [Saprospiraceae bacterium]
MRYDLISSSLFTDRRKAFIKKMKPGSIAIFCSSDQMPRSGDQHFPFRQDSALFALSGLDQPGTVIVLYPDAAKDSLKEIAFILSTDPEHTIWNGKRLDAKEAKKISGITTIKTIEAWNKIMTPLLLSANAIYINEHEQDRSHTEIPSQNVRMGSLLKPLYPSHTFLRPQPILQQLSMIKHPQEIELMKRSVEVTGLAFERVLKTIKPKLKEYEVEAELTYVLSANGCQHAFEPIVASGKSACILHYIKNDQVIKPDTLVLLDFGAEYAYMASDMSRTIPASGKFSLRQRQIYTSVLSVLNEVTDMMNPGMTINQLNKEAAKLIERELINLRILRKSDIRRQPKEAPLWKKYFMHGVSHHLGFDVHDISDRSVPFKAGMVLTCEPGIYIPEENIGIRLENDILITKKGHRNLMASIPIDPDEIESMMNTSLL